MSKEAKIGLIVLLAILVGYWGVQFLMGKSVFSNSKTFYSVYNNTGGLTSGSVVQFAGAKVGRVNSVTLFMDSTRTESNPLPEWLVEFSVDNDVLNITSSTVAKIEGNPLTSSIINLDISGIELAQSGDTLEGRDKDDLTATFTRELETLKASIQHLVGGVDGVVENINAIFADDATQGLPEVFSSLKRSIASLETTFSEVNNLLAENRVKFGNSMGNLEEITENFKGQTGKIDTIMTNFSSISDSLAQVEFQAIVRKVAQTLDEVSSITEKVNNGEGSLGQLINSDSLVVELQQSNQELQYLLNDIYTNPKKYLSFSVIGRKDRNGFSDREEDRIKEIIQEEK
ncbi:MAG: MlaD family protein [Flavobacteriales bacterium]